MTTEHDLAHGHAAPSAPSLADDDLLPGRGSRSSQLAAPSHPIAGGLLLRKARDANGVAEGADAAIAAASSSTGSPLPEAVQRKFESSLGADLSGVRVHTGVESKVAAESVGARAYAIGQDIHFAGGQYDPSNAAGQHLLAHEVAHTVQQGGVARTVQYKLEVSSPGDTAELEADRAADAMVSGLPAWVSPMNGVARKVVQRDANSMDFPVNGPIFNNDHSNENPDGSYKVLAADGYNSALDWNTVSGGDIPDDPTPTLKIGRAYPGAVPLGDLSHVEWDSSNMLIPKGFYEKRVSSYNALASVASALESTWNSSAKAIADFNHAKDEIKDQGSLGPAPAGENWNDVSSGANSYDQAANEQKVGVKADGTGGSTVADVFKQADGSAGTSPGGITDKGINAGSQQSKVAVSKLFEQCRLMDQKVDDANRAYETYLSTEMSSALGKVKLALGNVEIKHEKDEEDKKKAEKDEQEKAKKEAQDSVDKGVKFLTAIVKMAATDDKAKSGVEAASIVANTIIGGVYDEKIKQADLALSEAHHRVSQLTDKSLETALTVAQSDYQTLKSKDQEKRHAIQQALTARHDAYKAAAEAAANKAASSGDKDAKAQADKIRAAIEAIPRVETVVGRIRTVMSTLTDPPPYDATAGIQYSAATKNPQKNFDVKTLAMANAGIKKYKAKFDQLNTEWGAKLKSLQDLVGKFNVKGT